MDQIEYQLLARVAAGDGLLNPGGDESPYVLARLLQLRARGLVVVFGVPEDVERMSCRLTPEGMALLDTHRQGGGTRERREARPLGKPLPPGESLVDDRPTDQRRVRSAPKARLWFGRAGRYPGLVPDHWYALHTDGPSDTLHVWLKTAYGLTRVPRGDVELRGD